MNVYLQFSLQNIYREILVNFVQFKHDSSVTYVTDFVGKMSNNCLIKWSLNWGDNCTS